MKEWWLSFSFDGSPCFVLAKNMQALKEKLKAWNRDVFGRIDNLVQVNLVTNQTLDAKMVMDPDNVQLVNDKTDANAEFKRLAKMHSDFWKQRANINWVEDFENNTHFFHKYASAKQRGDSFVVSRVISRKVFLKTQLDGLAFPSISTEEAQSLEVVFSEEEVHKAICDLRKDKAPGPDGMPIFVISKSWEFMESDILKVMDQLYTRKTIDCRLKSTFFVLIPKVQDLENVTDFRPISLMSSINKIMSKVIATRLKSVLPKLVSHQQSAYVEGRQIMDNAIIANECINSAQISHEAGILGKIDFQKVYDNVAWSFLDYVLQRMGFEFKGAEAGGSPIPFLFLLTAESLNLMFVKAEMVGWLNGFEIIPGCQKITHLQFADDTPVFLKNDQQSIVHLRNILIWFEIISGLKVNFHKTALMPVGEVLNLDSLAASMGCRTQNLPTSYLGLPLGEPYRSNIKWIKIIEIFEARLSAWKSKSLSKGGKLTLIISELSSLPIYFFSIFAAPMNIIKNLERIIHNFLWDGGPDDKKYHPVDWEHLVKPKSLGGLGIKQLHFMNIALLMKWVWKFSDGDAALWKQLIEQKYDLALLGWNTKYPKQAYGCSIWRGHAPLSERFPTSFNASASKTSTVAQVYNNSSQNWNLGITRRVHDNVIRDIAALLYLFEESNLSPNSNCDTRVRKNSQQEGDFSVKKCYTWLIQAKISEEDRTCVHPKRIWSKCRPPKLIKENKTDTLLWRYVRGPVDAKEFVKYRVNGFVFSPKYHEEIVVSQDSGVCMTTNTTFRSKKGDKNPKNVLTKWYGVVNQIFELDYGQFTEVVFYCEWVKAGSGSKICLKLTVYSMYISS
ncbi:uncharacterized protein LOC113335301 [Papaver somniferum]|uniref:uncharacterized protein LOC113335301 n=1 Tax=Papaver somniferum TaxID=3469 RepID=UPI000E6FB37F|nr:uncharacterized protein LOC113335301 [Papaver somniferum]